MIIEESLIVKGHGVNYYITHSDAEHGPQYGIAEVTENDPSDRNATENIYFTREEAEQRCKWLCENQVYPISMIDVLRNII